MLQQIDQSREGTTPMVFDTFPDVQDMMLPQLVPVIEEPEKFGEAVTPVYGSISSEVTVDPIYECIIPHEPNTTVAYTDTIAYKRFAVHGLLPNIGCKWQLLRSSPRRI